MATEQTVTAIVLRRYDAGDSDRRITMLTAEIGKVDAYAKGARKAASRLASATEPLTVGTFHLAAGRARSFITQYQPSRSFPGLRREYERLMPALALAEFSAALLAPGQSDAEPFELLIRALAYIENHERPTVAAIWSLNQILAWEGVLPVFLENVLTSKPLDENPGYVSPTAGGFIGFAEAEHYRDAYAVRAEVLLGLGKIAELNVPPANLKAAEESAAALAPFLEHHAHAPLPALKQWVQSLS